MSLHTMRSIWLWIVVGGYLCFLDVPFLTWGQKYIAHRSHARLVLVSLELDLIALWAMAKFYLHWDRRLIPLQGEPLLGGAGLVVTLAGVVLADWAKLRLGRWFSATFGIKPGQELVTDGPYRLTRHPIYTGGLVAFLGSAMVWNSLLTLVLAVLFVVPLFFHTVYEEFEHHFGDAYFDYQRRVPRLVPFVRIR